MVSVIALSVRHCSQRGVLQRRRGSSDTDQRSIEWADQSRERRWGCEIVEWGLGEAQRSL